MIRGGLFNIPNETNSVSHHKRQVEELIKNRKLLAAIVWDVAKEIDNGNTKEAEILLTDCFAALRRINGQIE